MRHGGVDGLEATHLMAQYDTLEHDVLIIGAGGAGLRAAIEASAAGSLRTSLVACFCVYWCGPPRP